MSRIICGDALTELRKLPDKSVDMIFTDPPYGIPIGRTLPNGERVHVMGDDVAYEVFNTFLPEAARVLRPGACVCVCACVGAGPDPVCARWAVTMAAHSDLQFVQMVVWAKSLGLGWRYRSAHEMVLVAAKKGARMRWYDTTRRVGSILYGVSKVCASGKHPTEKPVALAAHFIGLHTQPGDTVLDPFCGFGSTGVAAVRAGRGFIGIELHPPYAEEAKRRIYGTLGVGPC